MVVNDLPPVSWASVIIGFISFTFTVSTFFKVIAGNLSTIAKAPTEAPYLLSNIKQELFEERLHLRRARRRSDRHIRHCRRNGIPLTSWDSGPAIRLLEATVRRLCKEFRDLERPFLIDRDDRGTGGNSKNRATTLEEGVKEREHEVYDDYMDGGFEHDYGTITLYHRLSWLRRKSSLVRLSQSLERLQIRRIGRETTDALNELKRVKTDLQDLKLIPGEDDSPRGGPGGGTGESRRSSAARRGSQKRHSSTQRRSRVEKDESSDSSESSDYDDEKVAAKEKSEKVHVRKTSYRVV